MPDPTAATVEAANLLQAQINRWDARIRSLANPAHVRPYIKTKVSATDGSNALLVTHIDARAAAVILDRVLGPSGWSFELLDAPLRPIEPEASWMKVYEGTRRDGSTYRDEKWKAYGTWIARGRLSLWGPVVDGRRLSVVHDDIGSASGDRENGAKGAASDALKRCAALAGIRACYALKGVWTGPGNYDKKNDPSVNPDVEARIVAGWKQQLKEWGAAFDPRAAVDDDGEPVGDDGLSDEAIARLEAQLEANGA
jgi:hypothetical protein